MKNRRYPLQKQAKEQHQKHLLMLLTAHQPQSRTQLAEQMQLSLTAVMTLTEELIEKGWIRVRKKERLAETGRPPELLELNPSGAYFGAISAHRDGLRGAVYDLQLHRTADFHLPYPKEWHISDKSSQIQTIDGGCFASFAARALQTLPADFRGRMQAAALSMPGSWDPDTQALLSVPLHARFAGSIADPLKERTGLPIVFGNGSDFCAYAEMPPFDAEKTDYLYVSLHYGVGAGVICGGTVFQLGSGHSTELGHMSIDYHGRPCSCGGRGCLERYVGFDAISDAMQQRTGERLAISEIARRYRLGDPAASAVMTDVAEKLVFGLANMTSVFRMEQVILGGGIEQFGDCFLTLLQNTLAQSAVRSVIRRTRFRYTSFDAYGELYGAARYTMEQVWLSGRDGS